MHASGGGRIPEPPKVAAVTTEAQQRRRAVLILYCTLTLSHYALLLVKQILIFCSENFFRGGSRDPNGGSPLHSLAGPGQQPSVAGNGPLGGAEAPNNPS